MKRRYLQRKIFVVVVVVVVVVIIITIISSNLCRRICLGHTVEKSDNMQHINNSNSLKTCFVFGIMLGYINAGCYDNERYKYLVMMKITHFANNISTNFVEESRPTTCRM
jgi:hypothetical protein